MLPASDELLDVVNDRDEVIDHAARAAVHARRLNHRAVHVLLVNDRGEIYLQLRAATKESFPGCWDSSASGHVAAGEDYLPAAVRELEEELGLSVAPDRLQLVATIPAGAATGWEFTRVYLLRGADQPRPNPAEVTRGEFVAPAALRDRLACQPAQFAQCFIKVFDEAAPFV